MASRKSDNEMITLDVFDGSNFAIWKRKLTIVLRTKRIDGVALGTEAKPEASNATKLEEWELKDCKAQDIISRSVTNDVFIHIMECESSNEMLEMLKSVYEGRNEAKVITLFNEWTKYEKNPSDSMAVHISKEIWQLS